MINPKYNENVLNEAQVGPAVSVAKPAAITAVTRKMSLMLNCGITPILPRMKKPARTAKHAGNRFVTLALLRKLRIEQEETEVTEKMASVFSVSLLFKNSAAAYWPIPTLANVGAYSIVPTGLKVYI